MYNFLLINTPNSLLIHNENSLFEVEDTMEEDDRQCWLIYIGFILLCPGLITFTLGFSSFFPQSKISFKDLTTSVFVTLIGIFVAVIGGIALVFSCRNCQKPEASNLLSPQDETVSSLKSDQDVKIEASENTTSTVSKKKVILIEEMDDDIEIHTSKEKLFDKGDNNSDNGNGSTKVTFVSDDEADTPRSKSSYRENECDTSNDDDESESQSEESACGYDFSDGRKKDNNKPPVNK